MHTFAIKIANISKPSVGQVILMSDGCMLLLTTIYPPKEYGASKQREDTSDVVQAAAVPVLRKSDSRTSLRRSLSTGGKLEKAI